MLEDGKKIKLNIQLQVSDIIEIIKVMFKTAKERHGEEILK